ncbi:hypothetical protein STVA_04510 [Allostella vacuolata]|nr:hypothetical protein STVA_04510 [Stella vacuolata]
MTARLRAHIAAADAEFAERKAAMGAKRLQLVQRQRSALQELKAVQETRTILESRQRANRLRKGCSACGTGSPAATRRSGS